jgi:hypothetical protein
MDLNESHILALHHVVPRKEGGSVTNLLLMHEHCHYESHTNQPLPLGKGRQKKTLIYSQGINLFKIFCRFMQPAAYEEVMV